MALAGMVWWSVILGLGFLAVWALLVDTVLESAGQCTITEYLTARPLAFWIPLVLFLVVCVVLVVHLSLHVANK
jgi:hypothetical protein